MHKVIGIFKSQGLLWLGDLYTAIRVIIITVVLAAIGISGWATLAEDEFVSPAKVLANPEIIVKLIIQQSFPNGSICNTQGECFILTFED